MTNPSPAPQPPQQEGLKALAVKGIIGAVTLAGTTAIPITINRVLNPPSPAPTVTPSPEVSTSPSPSPSPAASVPATSASSAPEVQANPEDHSTVIHDEKPHEDGPGKKKGKKKKD